MYDPKNHKAEFENIQNSALRLAIRELSENQQRIIYLRFWCDYSINDIARELCSGVNIIDQVCDATISKLKRKIIQIEFNPSLEGGPSCA